MGFTLLRGTQVDRGNLRNTLWTVGPTDSSWGANSKGGKDQKQPSQTHLLSPLACEALVPPFGIWWVRFGVVEPTLGGDRADQSPILGPLNDGIEVRS